MNTKALGTINEEQCKLYWMELGYDVSTPVGDNAPYDFILDYESHLLKIQCKKPTFHGTYLSMDLTTNICNRNILKTFKYPPGSLDYYAGYYSGVCYLVPYKSGLGQTILRLEPPRNHNRTGINWAYQYEGDYILSRRYHPESTPVRNDPVVERPKCANRQWYWITNGIVNKRVVHLEDMPDGYRIGRIT